MVKSGGVFETELLHANRTFSVWRDALISLSVPLSSIGCSTELHSAGTKENDRSDVPIWGERKMSKCIEIHSSNVKRMVNDQQHSMNNLPYAGSVEPYLNWINRVDTVKITILNSDQEKIIFFISRERMLSILSMLSENNWFSGFHSQFNEHHRSEEIIWDGIDGNETHPSNDVYVMINRHVSTNSQTVEPELSCFNDNYNEEVEVSDFIQRQRNNTMYISCEQMLPVLTFLSGNDDAYQRVSNELAKIGELRCNEMKISNGSESSSNINIVLGNNKILSNGAADDTNGNIASVAGGIKLEKAENEDDCEQNECLISSGYDADSSNDEVS